MEFSDDDPADAEKAKCLAAFADENPVYQA